MATHYTLSGSNVVGLCAGIDGNIWATDNATHVIKVTPTGTGTRFTFAGKQPYGICAAAGNLWATDFLGNVLEVNYSGSLLNTYALASTALIAICLGSDGNLYCCDESTPALWQVTTAGVEVSTGTAHSPTFACNGPDGNIWASAGSGHVMKLTLPGLTMTNFIVSSSAMNGICVGPDNNLWACDFNGVIWQLNTSGTVLNSYTIDSGQRLYSICAGLDGNLWIADVNAKIWKVTTAGVATSIGLSGSAPDAISPGLTGQIWIGDGNGGIWQQQAAALDVAIPGWFRLPRNPAIDDIYADGKVRNGFIFSPMVGTYPRVSMRIFISIGASITEAGLGNFTVKPRVGITATCKFLNVQMRLTTKIGVSSTASANSGNLAGGRYRR